jgi:uncharacterized protein YbjQ (UPF0145 family)
MESQGLSDLLALIQLLLPLLVLIGAYLIGHILEKRHYQSIREREQQLLPLAAITFRRLPPNWQIERSGLVTGSVVVSIDYFKRFLASLRGIIGGEIKSYGSLLDRARREAVLRMKEEAASRGYNVIWNVRLETSRLASSRKDGQGTAGVEMLAFGTGLRVRGG